MVQLEGEEAGLGTGGGSLKPHPWVRAWKIKGEGGIKEGSGVARSYFWHFLSIITLETMLFYRDAIIVPKNIYTR